MEFHNCCLLSNFLDIVIQRLHSMRWFSHRRSPSPRAATQWYRLLLLAAWRRTPYYALSMGMTQQFFVFFCPWWPWPLTLTFELQLQGISTPTPDQKFCPRHCWGSVPRYLIGSLCMLTFPWSSATSPVLLLPLDLNWTSCNGCRCEHLFVRISVTLI